MISDGAHSGTPGFYFAPPLGHLSAATGAFDASLEPVIDVCAWNGASCGAQVAHFEMHSGTERIKLLAEDELYGVTWKTNGTGLISGQMYRIVVSVSGTTLGFADFRVSKNTNSVAGTYDLQAGQTLPVKFRIERGIVTTIGPAGGTVRSSDGKVTLDVPSGAIVAPTGLVVVPAETSQSHPRLVPGTAYDFGPDGTTFSPPANLTIEYDPARLPLGVSEVSLAVGHLVGGAWVVQPGSVVNTINHTVTAAIAGFSSYAIVGDVTPAAGLAYTAQSGSGDRDVFIHEGSVRQVTSGAGNDGSPDWLGTQLLMYSDRAGSYDVWRLGDQPGQPLLNLSASAGTDEAEPRWSPDGSRVAYVQFMGGADTDIWVMNADGSGRVNLTAHPAADGAPSWSPDGTRIAFHSNRGGNTQVFVMQSDGSAPVQLTSDPTWGGYAPDWSPDGTRLVFARMILGTDADLWTMNADGSSASPLTSGPTVDYNPAWSPDGSQVVFERFASVPSGRSDLWLVTSDGALLSPVAAAQSADERSPAWKKQPIIPLCGPADEMMALVNGHRLGSGLPAFGIDARLIAAALRHSLDMASTGVLSHTGSDGSTFAQRILQAGFSLPFGELVANTPGNATSLFLLWKTSPQGALLASLEATHIGAATSGAFWTLTLGKSDPSVVVAPTPCFGPLPVAPVLDPIGNVFIEPGQSVTLTVRAADGNGDPISFALNSAPGFASLTDHGNGTATLSIAPTVLDAGNYAGVQVVASDGVLIDQESLTIRVGNRPPTIVVGANVDPFLVVAGEAVNVPVFSSDPDADPITLQALNLPGFASFTDNGDGTGLLTISPPGGSVSMQTISLAASDGLASTVVSQTIQVIAPACGVAGDMLNLINTERARAGQSALVFDTRLIQAAAQHSADMAATGVLSHTGSDGSSYLQRIAATGYDSPSGELVANVSSLPAATFDMWRMSGPHRAVMTASNQRHIGVAASGVWWTVTFGASLNAAQQPAGCVP